MEVVQIKCEVCGKDIYVIDRYTRNKMFCTLGCLDIYEKMNEKMGN